MIFVDAHVHIYDNFNLEKFFDNALSNFRKVANEKSKKNFFFFLLLAESHGFNYFNRLKEINKNNNALVQSIGKWSVSLTQDINSIIINTKDNNEIFLISGRQVISKEGFEVLALFSNLKIEDGLPIAELLDLIIKVEGLPVIPWGFGKWLGKRKDCLLKILNGVKYSNLFLGDNSGRISIIARPKIFNIAEKKGIRILAGTDPLPLSSEEKRPGSFGFSIKGSITRENPAIDLKQKIINHNSQFESYGKLENPLRFMRNQLAMQVRKKSMF